MTVTIEPDALKAASHRNLVDHLTAPFAAGAVDTVMDVDSAGLIDVPVSRAPLILIAPATPLRNEKLRVSAVVDPTGAAQTLIPLEFAPFTEEDAFLVAYVPPTDPQTQTAAPFALQLGATRGPPNGPLQAVTSANIAATVHVRLVQGIMGQLLQLLGDEKKRMRRHGREILSARLVSSARDDALDRMGAEVGVPRLANDLTFAGGEIVTQTRREPDDEYRRRVQLFRSFVQPNRAQLLSALNGPPAPSGAPNGGLLGKMGVVERFAVVEEDNDFAVAIHLVTSGPTPFRANFLDFVRQAYQVLPGVANDPVHASRFLPGDTLRLTDELRARLRSDYVLAGNILLAPMLAAALDRLGRCRRALGDTTQWTVTGRSGGQPTSQGSRYELGLGVDLRIPAPGVLDGLVSTLQDPNRASVPDSEVEALLESMQPMPAADDPIAAWLLNACGLKTAHLLTGSEVYVSHFPTFGLKITGANATPPGTPLPLEVRYHAPGDPGSNAVLVAGLAVAATAWAAAGGAAWTVLSDAAARTRWSTAVDVPVAHPATGILGGAGLTVIPVAATVVDRLTQLPDELVATIVLPAALAQSIINGTPAAMTELSTVVGLFRDESIASVVTLVTGAGEVLLVLGAIGLPLVGANLTGRRGSGFRWYVVPLEGNGGTIGTLGSRTEFTPDGPGLSAIIVVGYARAGRSDPYEFRVELPSGALLNLKQYEFLMNLLDHFHPTGIEVNTYAIRQTRVDLDGDGSADSLQPTAARTFRPFRRRRFRGEVTDTL